MAPTINPVFKYWLNNIDHIKAHFVSTPSNELKLKIKFQNGAILFDPFGRPDSRRPHNKNSYYHYLLYRYRALHKNRNEMPFSKSDHFQVEQEITLYLIRALAFIQVKKYYLAKNDIQFVSRALGFIIETIKDRSTQDCFCQYLSVFHVLEIRTRSLIEFEENNYFQAKMFMDKANILFNRLYRLSEDSCTIYSLKELNSLKKIIFGNPNIETIYQNCHLATLLTR